MTVKKLEKGGDIMKKALVIGSLNIDMTTKVENLPRLGETIFGNNFYESCGGKGANQAVAISKLGMETEMIGMIGNDSHGKKLIENLKKYNVKHDNIIRSPEPTGHALILVDKNGNNSIIVIPGANFKITERHIDEKTDIINENDIIILQNEIPLNVVEHALKKAKELNKITVFNPAPAAQLSDEVYKNTDYLILNETEMEEIFEISIEDEKYIERLHNRKEAKNIRNIILTLGETGSVLLDDEGNIRRYEAYKVKAVDTTAAGDSFIGAFILKLCETGNRDTAMKFASAVSAIVVTRQGAQDSIPTALEIAEFIEKMGNHYNILK